MKSIFRPFPLPLSGRQKFYLFFLQGGMAGLIDAGANFGIAYAMYSKQSVVKMWIFDQNTIAGDLGVTPIIQTLVSMLISSTLVHTDLHNSKIRPLAFCYPHVENLPDPRLLFGKSNTQSEAMRGIGEKSRPTSELSTESDPSHPTSGKKGFSYYYWMSVRFIFEGTEQNMLAARPGFKAWLGRLAWTAAQGAAIGIVFGFPIWCLFIVILGPIYGMGNMGGSWAPQIIKAVYAAVVGWVTNPVIAILALGSQAEQSLVVVEVDEEAEVGGQEELADESTSQTIHEDEEFMPPPALPVGSKLIHRQSANSLRIAPTPNSPSAIFARNRADSGAASLRSSSIHSRPPLTANASFLTPLPSPVDILSPSGGRSRARSNAQAGSVLAPPIDGTRQRGATVSHPSPLPSPAITPGIGSGSPRQPMTPRSFSYALGGTGGRAQRSRSGSVISQIPGGVGTSQIGNAEEKREPKRLG